MKKHMKRIITMLVASMVAGSSLAVPAFAEAAAPVDPATIADPSATAIVAEPEPDTTLKAKATGRGHIKLTWKKVSDSEGYVIYRSTKANKKGEKIYSTSKSSKKSYTDKKAKVKKTYYYSIDVIEPEPEVITADPALLTATADASAIAEDEDFVNPDVVKVKNKLNVKKTLKVKAYAYTGGGHTASGKKAQEGRIAVDPKVIKLGTWLYVEGYGLCQACDTGGAIKGKTIDVYFDKLNECYKWGVKYPKVYVLE
jgi:3D (Asp-Asp-Asp) domain-containing protein